MTNKETTPNKEIIALCLSDLWNATRTPQFLSEYQEYQLARILQRIHRRFVYGITKGPYREDKTKRH